MTPTFHNPGSVTFRTTLPGDLAALRNPSFSSGVPSRHDDRLARQAAGEVDHALAMRGTAIIGHRLVRWEGPESPVVRDAVASCAEIEDLVVGSGPRGKGISSAEPDRAARSGH